MNDIAILGYTGFVGSTILRLLNCECDLYNSKNIDNVKGKKYKKIYCACMPGVKWKANKEPREDFNTLIKIINCLSEVECENFYLVSSQDCNSNLSSDESFTTSPPTVYGIHRLRFEWFIRYKFPNARIMRIGCLFGERLKKNVIFDFMNDNIQYPLSNTTYQLYYMDNLLSDFELMDKENIFLMNRFSEPVWTSEIADIMNIKVSFDSEYEKYNNKGKYILDKTLELQYLKEYYDRNKFLVIKK